ncbi:hypothetical protein PR202_gb11047 [Eleusine coracana subsp. coracana]|uniref:Uncharacterized protein n=1 Tax=Eleusine coracana subsp. coracana TaxID=191504 RepID=A0AAV5ELX6_ELECO|nr:hypothetical protein PR202_gb11047 [Eleusine coracana subsp. coracana]
MASTTLAASHFLAPLPAANSNKHVSLRVPACRLPTAASAAQSGGAAAAAARERRRILERYGLNPDDFVDEVEDDSRDRRKSDRRRRRSGRGEEDSEVSVSQKKAVEPRETHKMLQSAGGSPASLRPGRWLDLYSGTGSVGIEAMSRGCSEVHFVEMDPWVISEVLKPNLECTGFLGVSHIHMYRVENFLAIAEKSKDS